MPVREISRGKKILIKIRAMLMYKCLQILHFGIMKMPDLIILSSEQ